MHKKTKINAIHAHLQALFPHPACELHYTHEYELLFAIILSAQTTDMQVNKATSRLFAQFTTLESYANANIADIENEIRSIGLYKAKARYIHQAAQIICTQFHGKIPRTIADLQTLSGVGRKTANVFLWEFHGINEGMAIDTHIARLAWRLGLSKSHNVLHIEKDLCRYLPQQEWGNFGHRLILYGRYYWPARLKTHDGVLNQFAISPYKAV